MALRSEYESRILSAIQPLEALQNQFESAIYRIRTAEPDSASTQKAASDILSALLKGQPPVPTGHPELDQLRGIFLQQQEVHTRNRLATWARLTDDHRGNLERLKVSLDMTALGNGKYALQQEFNWLDAEQDLIRKGRIPWQAGDRWREIMQTMSWQGGQSKQETEGSYFLRANSNEEPRLLFDQNIPPPFEVEMVVIPDNKEFKLYFITGRIGFNHEDDPSSTMFVNFLGKQNIKIRGKTLKPGVEQKVTLKVETKRVEILVDDISFQSFKVDNSGAQCRLSLGPAKGSSIVLKSVKYRRPGQIHRPPPPVQTK